MHIGVARTAASQGDGDGRLSPEDAALCRETWQTRIVAGKIRYYADFLVYGLLVLAIAVLTCRKSSSEQWAWLSAAMVGGFSWTLVEYVLHRFVFHGVPFVAELHHAHHISPRAYLGTPTWASLAVLMFVVLLPIWRLTSLNVALGAVSGLVTGWLWYGVVHHVIHHRRPRRLATALRVASNRHFLHHAPHASGNFGVTTGIWDCVFGTEIPLKTRAVDVAVQRRR
jgi:sterol desaturase/sphingolipid hydroxylase (fatty acid hydroxylase superfamily)